MENQNKEKMSGTKAFWIIALIALAIAGGYWFVSMNPKVVVKDVPKTAVTSTPVTIYGTYVCLPHKITTGPQTLECTFGLKADSDGVFYGLDLADISPNVVAILKIGSMITVEGNLTTNVVGEIQKYNINGTIHAKNIVFGNFDSKG